MEKIVIYQVLPRLFGNQCTENIKNGTLLQNGCGKFADFSEKALSAIKKLGATHIWYTGVIEHATQTDYSRNKIRKDNPIVVKGQAGSPYAIKDYYDIDPDLATTVKNRIKEFEALVKRSHEAGLKVIMDFVPNHVARQYHSDAKPAGTRDLGEDDVTSVSYNRDNNFYYLPDQKFVPCVPNTEGGEDYVEYPAKVTGNDCFWNAPSVNDWYETVKLNYGVDYNNNHCKDFFPTPNTWQKMRDILLYWSAKGVDGFRCDMAEMVPVEFWQWVIPQVKNEHPGLIFIAETYDPNQYGMYLYDGHFDYLYDKVGLYDTLKGVIRGEQPTSNITFCWQSHPDLEDRLLNFLENHDEQRIASEFFAGNAEKAMPAMLISATLTKGPVMVYCGQELGEAGMDEEGFSGRDGRTTIFDYWSVESIRNWVNGGKMDGKKLTTEQKALQKRYAKLLNICNKEKAIAEGEFFDLMYCNYENPDFDSTKQYVFLRKKDKDLLLIVSNFEDKDVNVTVNIAEHAFDYLGIGKWKEYAAKELINGETRSMTLSPDSPVAISIPANSGVIWKITIK
ncbi:MAG: alpha-amylase family protein [Paludibacteraceae bacterium]|nr:alpha-amylase family protein [Paludibacteraceae bacterium]